MSFLQICTKLLNYSRSYTSTREDSIVTVNLLEINYVDLLLINFSPNDIRHNNVLYEHCIIIIIVYRWRILYQYHVHRRDEMIELFRPNFCVIHLPIMRI